MKALLLHLKQVFTPQEVASAVPGNIFGWLHSLSLGSLVSLTTIAWFGSKTFLLWWDRYKKRTNRDDPNI